MADETTQDILEIIQKLRDADMSILANRFVGMPLKNLGFISLDHPWKNFKIVNTIPRCDIINTCLQSDFIRKPKCTSDMVLNVGSKKNFYC